MSDKKGKEEESFEEWFTKEFSEQSRSYRLSRYVPVSIAWNHQQTKYEDKISELTQSVCYWQAIAQCDQQAKIEKLEKKIKAAYDLASSYESVESWEIKELLEGKE